MKTFKTIVLSTIAALSLTTAQPAAAQTTLPAGALPMIVAPHAQSISYKERTMNFDITANVGYSFSTEADWLKVQKSVNGILVHAAENYYGEARTGNISLTSTDGTIVQTLAITQAANTAAADLPQDASIKPSSASANTSQSGYGINLTYDGDYSTYWHSQWSGSNFSVSESNPAILIYNFTGSNQIDYITYVPRQDGNTNGSFKTVQVWVKLQGESDYTLVKTLSWSGSGGSEDISFDSPLVNVASIKFVVTSGSNNNASCAEMEFHKKTTGTGGYEVFADDLYTKLVDGVTEDQIADLDNPLAKSLAYQILKGTYDTAYRVANYKCYNSYNYYSDLWNAPGKYYDQVAGVTGINIEPNSTFAVVVRDIPENMSAQLKVVAWYVGKDGSNFDGGNPNTTTFSLKNGINVINYTYDWAGLAYICYYDENGQSATRPDLRVHFINGQVNGYLSPEKSNDEMHQLTANAKNTCMDVLGKEVHSVWTAKGLHNYCKATDGSSIGYRQYMNVLDSLVHWEHQLLGFPLHGLEPDLRTMAYTNYTYYMFQGSFGVSFHHNQESRVLNCKTLVYNDEDAIWGLSHEWGHQHQMQPYFCWAGLSEVTNNMNSYYNIMHMGYSNSRDKQNFLNAANNYALNRDAYSANTKISEHRRQAYNNRSYVDWNTELQNLCASMADSTIYSVNQDSTRAFAAQDLSVGDQSLVAFIKMYIYFRDNGFPNIAQDWYQALRETDNENGSTVEKQDGLDKYELLNSAQNSNATKWTQFKSTYPNSVWTKNNYVSPSKGWYSNSVPAILNYIRKVSRLTGYNLTPYYEAWGFIRPVAMRVGDYGNKWYLMTQSMLDEFKEDMEALNLKECDEEMVKSIATWAEKTFARPTFPN